MRLIRILLLCVLAVPTLLACSTPDRVVRIRALSEPAQYSKAEAPLPPNNGSFSGFDAIRQASKSGDVDILFIHGIGWTQKEDKTQFGFDLANAVVEAYGGTKSWESATDLCPQSAFDKIPLEKDNKNGLTIKSIKTDPAYYAVPDDPEIRLYLTDLGCLDRISIDTSKGFRVNIYRYFWDDALWNSLEWVHTGYDDTALEDNTGYDDIESYRATFNANTKNQVLTWGLVDAATYLGPAGQYVREGVKGAICAVIGGDNYRAGAVPGKDGMLRLSSLAACSRTDEPQNSLAILSHSLGSRVVFDVLKTSLDPALARRLNSLPNQEIEAYFLANQIPLFGSGLIAGASDTPLQRGKLSKKLKFVAFSEVNDLLTYELVPYFEHLYYLRCFGYQDASQRDVYPSCANFYPADYQNRRRNFGLNRDLRDKLVAQLGFDAVDVRVKFVGTLPILDLARPDTAHSGYLSQSRSVRQLLFCGVKRGDMRDARAGCESK